MAVETKIAVTRSIPAALEELDAYPSGDGWVLSAYIDTSPARTMGSAYLLAFRDRVSAIRDAQSESPESLADEFDRAAAAIEAYFAEPFAAPDVSAGVFANAGGVRMVVPVPARVRDQVYWAPSPVTTPMRDVFDDLERVGVLLFDKERTRFFTIALGEIESRAEFADDVSGKQATGDWFGLSQKRYLRHHEQEVLRHAKRTIRFLLDEVSRHPFDRLFIAGPDEAVSVLRHHMPRRIGARFAGELAIEVFAPESDVLRAAQPLIEESERRQELADVEELINSRTPHAAIGFENTLQALHEGRIDRLFVARPLTTGVLRCVDCGRLTAMEPCPVCTGETVSAGAMPEPAVSGAIDQGAKIEIVSGQAAEVLMNAGGLGAWCRRSER